MTQAVNLANFANYLDTSGGVSPSALNASVPISKGGTNASTTSGARTNLGLAIGTDIPSVTGSGASGDWNINSSGVKTTNFTIVESGGVLLFKYGATTIASLDSSGNFSVAGNVNSAASL